MMLGKLKYMRMKCQCANLVTVRLRLLLRR